MEDFGKLHIISKEFSRTYLKFDSWLVGRVFRQASIILHMNGIVLCLLRTASYVTIECNHGFSCI